MTGQALIVQGDALHLPLPDASVDLVVTSPPYWALRAYQAGPGEIGSEPTPQAFLEALWAATAEMARVLKPSGSMFVDLGDKYAAGHGGSSTMRNGGYGANLTKAVWDEPGYEPNRAPGYGSPKTQAAPKVVLPSTRPKSLMLLPERYRIGCVDHLGLIARAVIVWNKPNGLPESVTDRVRRSHEDWVHLVKQPRYYSALDEVREAHSEPWRSDGRKDSGSPKRRDAGANGGFGLADEFERNYNPLGKLPGSVWSIPSEPLRLPEHLGVQHYAAFPSEWPRRLILGFSPPGICLDCGQGRVPVVERGDYQSTEPGGSPRHLSGWDRPRPHVDTGNDKTSTLGYRREATILGYACSCTPYTDHTGKRGDWREGRTESADHLNSFEEGGSGNAVPRRVGSFGPGGKYPPPEVPRIEYHLAGWKPPPTRPAIILDPFGGTGTTAMVARALGRVGVSVDLSAAYGRAARWRVRHDGAKAISRTNLERQGMLL